MNDTQEILEAFKVYHTTAELADVTDPNLVYNLRAKLDGAGHHDDFEVERVVVVALKPNAKQSELVSALEPVVDRVTKRFHETKQGVRYTISEPARPLKTPRPPAQAEPRTLRRRRTARTAREEEGWSGEGEGWREKEARNSGRNGTVVRLECRASFARKELSHESA